MLEQRIQQQFFESADLKYQAAEVLGRPIEQAVAALVAGLTAGGRVLCVTVLADSVKQAQQKAYEVAKGIHFDGQQYRKDIGYRAIKT
mgnify:CR=1 FL=1